MTDYTDIPKRLRAYEYDHELQAELGWNAADAIEALTKEVEKLKGILNEGNLSSIRENEVLKQRVFGRSLELDRSAARIEAQAARIAELEAGLAHANQMQRDTEDKRVAEGNRLRLRITELEEIVLRLLNGVTFVDARGVLEEKDV